MRADLITQLSSTDPKLRVMAARTLVSSQHPEVVLHILSLRDDPAWFSETIETNEYAAGTTLADLSGSVGAEVTRLLTDCVPKLTAYLARELKHGDRPELAAMALALFGDLEARDPLLAALAHRDDRVVRQAVRGLARLGSVVPLDMLARVAGFLEPATEGDGHCATLLLLRAHAYWPQDVDRTVEEMLHTHPGWSDRLLKLPPCKEAFEVLALFHACPAIRGRLVTALELPLPADDPGRFDELTHLLDLLQSMSPGCTYWLPRWVSEGLSPAAAEPVWSRWFRRSALAAYGRDVTPALPLLLRAAAGDAKLRDSSCGRSPLDDAAASKGHHGSWSRQMAGCQPAELECLRPLLGSERLELRLYTVQIVCGLAARAAIFEDELLACLAATPATSAAQMQLELLALIGLGKGGRAPDLLRARLRWLHGLIRCSPTPVHRALAADAIGYVRHQRRESAELLTPLYQDFIELGRPLGSGYVLWRACVALVRLGFRERVRPWGTEMLDLERRLQMDGQIAAFVSAEL